MQKKIIAFETRPNEQCFFDQLKVELGLDVVNTEQSLSEASLCLTEGAYGISILGHNIIDKVLIDELCKRGVRHISTRTIGMNHIDLDYAHSKGMLVTNAKYAPDCVAEFTIMLMLMSLRKYKAAMFRGNVNDYSLDGLQGKELKHCVVGVVGTGSIGLSVIRLLSGFGCKILVYSPTGTIKPEVSELATYVDLDTLFRLSDIVTFHIPLLDSTRGMVDKRALSLMKPGVGLINCSRGELMKIDEIIDAVETRKVGFLGLDVFEDEIGIYHHDRRMDIISNRNMAYLRQFPNVVMTQHMAFYTETSTFEMVQASLESFVAK